MNPKRSPNDQEDSNKGPEETPKVQRRRRRLYETPASPDSETKPKSAKAAAAEGAKSKAAAAKTTAAKTTAAKAGAKPAAKTAPAKTASAKTSAARASASKTATSESKARASATSQADSASAADAKAGAKKEARTAGQTASADTKQAAQDPGKTGRESGTGPGRAESDASQQHEEPIIEVQARPRESEEDLRDREFGADEIVRRSVLYALGAGLVPLPVIDLAAITYVQVKMLKRLSSWYGFEFSENRGKSYVSSLLSSVLATSAAYGAVGRSISLIPGVGRAFALVTMPVFSGAATYAVGRVFIQHFESGGTFLDFEPEKVKKYFAGVYKQGRSFVANMQKQEQAQTQT